MPLEFSVVPPKPPTDLLMATVFDIVAKFPQGSAPENHTQKGLGMAIGFDEKTADVRIAQYESGTRTPKEKLTAALAHVLEVDPRALDVPDIDSYVGLMHTLFALEDLYGLYISDIDGELCLRLDKRGA